MSEISVRAEKLAKWYRIGVRRRGKDWGYRTLRDTLVDAATYPLRQVRHWLEGPGKSGHGGASIWALRDVSFEVKQGEIVGLIGRNGAGKSTLLRILSRITEPTRGWAEVRGRVGALLEVGTGFHPELTGRENIYLNGAILGMRRVEVRRKFDEIVAFAEVEQFIDTPVKHYSSGMHMRLAFAVAAHLEPDVLFVDEVLSVGDARFQRKCLDKMEDVSHGGRTVLFVSHNMPAVTRLCPRCILLDEGVILKDGPSHEVVGAYLNAGLGTTAAREWSDLASAPRSDIIRLVAVRVRDGGGRVTDAMDIRRPVIAEVEFEVLQAGHVLMPYLEFRNERGIVAFRSVDIDPAWRKRPRPPGRYSARAKIPGNLLAEGTMFVTAGIAKLDPLIVQVNVREAVAFQVIDTIDGDSARGDYGGTMGGVVRPRLHWDTEYEPAHPNGQG